MQTRILATAFVTAACLTATATDYYVSKEGSDSNDGLTLETALATVAKANAKAGNVGSNRILIAPGEYESATANGDMFQGPTVLGLGAKPTDVVLRHSGGYRPVKVSAGEVRNLTICGGASTSLGGCVYMTGGLIDNCVLTNGVATTGGNLWISGGTVAHSQIVCGTAASSGGNVYMNGGVVQDCQIANGLCNGSASDWNHGGGNVYIEKAASLLSRCVITGGDAPNAKGGGVRTRHANAVVEDCLIAENPGGGALIESGSKFYNCTIVKNLGNGVWLSSTTGGTLVNCVVYGNMAADGASAKDWAGNTLNDGYVVNCALGVAKKGGLYELTDDSAFADYAKGDYRPKAGGVLEDTGAEDPRISAASTLDVAGNPRICNTVDIGAYELQKTAFTFGFNIQNPQVGLPPQEVVFVNHVQDKTGAVTYLYDFGDGTTGTYTDAETVTHTYTKPGNFSVSVTATDESAQTRTVIRNSLVQVVDVNLYVVAGNPNAAAPYNSFSNAAATVSAAVALAVPGCTVTVSNGLYEVSSQIVVNKGITVRGLTGDPEDVIVRNTHAISGDCEFRAFKVESADALVSGVAMENGASRNRLGGGLFVSAGCVSNCVIRNCSLQSSYYGCGAGVRLDGANARLTHCVVTNNVLSGSSTEWYRCAGVSLKGGASAENCLIAYNRATGSGTPSSIVGGVLMESEGDRLINCTIVSNVVEYPVTSAWAGLRPSWHGTVQNCVIAENYNLSPQVEQVGEDGTKTYVPVEGPQLASVAGYADSYVGNCVTDQPTATDKFTVAASGTLFRDFASGDLEPALGGPLYDAGLAVTGQPAVDLAGNPRVHGRRIDIGCYESPRSKGFTLIVR